MEQKGDFLGFEFAGKHSSELNIIRASGGDRFEEQVIPEIKDIAVEVPGMDGQYYFGSTYGPRTFNISIAYNQMTEENFRELRKVYGRKRIGALIFDERPYKKYMVKIESPIQLSYICFDEPIKTIVGTSVGDERYGVRRDLTTREPERIYPYAIDHEHTQRIYKGEGNITFISYFPFAKSVFKVLDTNELKNSDWAVSSGILTDDEYINIDKYKNGIINIYNAGDVATGFRLYVPREMAEQGFSLTYHAMEDSTDVPAQLIVNPISIRDNDIGVLVDTNNGLIVGIRPQTTSTTTMIFDPDTGEVKEIGVAEQQVGITYDTNRNAQYFTSGNLYNEYIDSGYFFKFQPNHKTDGATLQIQNGIPGIEIFYDYLYF